MGKDLVAPSEDTPELRDSLSNVEAEQMVLGCVLLNNFTYDRVAQHLGPQDFSEGLHARIWGAIEELIGQGRTASPITLSTYFEADPAMADVGGTDYLARISAWATPSSTVTDYARLVRGLAVRRQLLEISDQVKGEALHATVDEDPDDLIDRAQESLDQILNRQTLRDSTTIGEAGAKAVRNAERAYQHKGELLGEPTHIKALDSYFGGFERSDLIIVAGRPGMGKSALALSIAKNMVEGTPAEGARAKTGVLFSLEMSDWQLAQRWLAISTGLDLQDIKRGRISEADYRRLAQAGHDMMGKGLHIDDTGGLNIRQLRARVRRLHRQHGGLDFIIVDYLQLLSGVAKGRETNRVQEVTGITTALKSIAKEFDVPLIALSQLSRAVENRADKRPVLADLRESGSIEQDADVVLFCFRAHYYLKLEGPPKDAGARNDWEAEIKKTEREAEVICAKWRSGPTGQMVLQFHPATTEFSDWAEQEREVV